MTPLTIATDYDRTFTADCELWRCFISTATKFGHRIICVSARENTPGNRYELTQAMPISVPVLLCYGHPKREHAAGHGYDVDIWIDDHPETVSQAVL
jgi:hypothetical protein